MNLVEKITGALARLQAEKNESTQNLEARLKALEEKKAQLESLSKLREQVTANRKSYEGYLAGCRESVASLLAGQAEHVGGRRRDDAHSGNGDARSFNTYANMVTYQAIVADGPRVLAHFDQTLAGIDAELAAASKELEASL